MFVTVASKETDLLVKVRECFKPAMIGIFIFPGLVEKHYCVLADSVGSTLGLGPVQNIKAPSRKPTNMAETLRIL